MSHRQTLARCAAMLAMSAFLGLSQGVSARAAEAIPTKPESGKFKLGMEPWLGYGMWYVAAKKGFFVKEGLTDVELVNFTEDKDINAALASGQIDAGNIATHTTMGMVAAGLPIKSVMLLDFSLTADAIIAGKDIKTIADLKGKSVAFEEGTTSDILLNYALNRNGLSIADVKPVPMPAADAGSALIADRVPVAVTYEPYISAAKKQDLNLNLLFTAGEDPGLVSDVLDVRDDVAKAKPGQVLAMLRAWQDALDDYRAHTTEDRKIIADAVGSPPDDLTAAFDGVRYYSVKEAQQAFAGDFTSKTFVDVLKAAKQAKLVTKDVTSGQVIDPAFVDVAAK